LRRQLIGLLRAGTYVLRDLRDRERETKTAQRERRPPAPRSNTSTVRATVLLPWLQHLSNHQRQVVTKLASGSTVTEVAKDIGKTYQAVQNALRRNAGHLARFFDEALVGWD
jgi:DNA-directed RNA polymerase specialized sigma24 family protein